MFNETDGGIPPEAREFRADLGGSESQPEKPSTTTEKQERNAETTNQVFEPEVTEEDAEMPETMKMRQEQRREEQEGWRRKWERRSKALQSLQPSGVVIADTKALLEAAELEPERYLNETYRAYQEGDSTPVLELLQQIEQDASALPQGEDDQTREYFAAFYEALKRITHAAKQGQHKK